VLKPVNDLKVAAKLKPEPQVQDEVKLQLGLTALPSPLDWPFPLDQHTFLQPMDERQPHAIQCRSSASGGVEAASPLSAQPQPEPDFEDEDLLRALKSYDSPTSFEESRSGEVGDVTGFLDLP
jgi:hypothetical protein